MSITDWSVWGKQYVIYLRHEADFSMIFYREKESKKSDKHSETNIGKRKTGKGTVKKNEQFKFF